MLPRIDQGSTESRPTTKGAPEAPVAGAELLWRPRYGRWKARLGAPKAITAMAHKLARVLWHLLKFKEAFNPEVFAKEEAKMKRKKLQRLEAMATSLNYRIIPIQ